MSRVIELMPDRDVRLARLRDGLDQVISDFVADNNVTYSSVVGTLESIKFDLLMDSRDL